MLPPGVAGGLVGQTLTIAAVTATLSGQLIMGSNAVELDVVPWAGRSRGDAARAAGGRCTHFVAAPPASMHETQQPVLDKVQPCQGVVPSSPLLAA